MEIIARKAAFGGKTFGFCGGKKIFVPYAIPGERLEVRVEKDAGEFLEGKIERILEASPHRVFPPCPLFGKCGGCDFMHIGHPFQIELKLQTMRDAFERLKIPLPKIRAASASEWGYRNRVRLSCGGFEERGTKRTVAVRACPVACEKINGWLLENPFELRPKCPTMIFASEKALPKLTVFFGGLSDASCEKKRNAVFQKKKSRPEKSAESFAKKSAEDFEENSEFKKSAFSEKSGKDFEKNSRSENSAKSFEENSAMEKSAEDFEENSEFKKSAFSEKSGKDFEKNSCSENSTENFGKNFGKNSAKKNCEVEIEILGKKILFDARGFFQSNVEMLERAVPIVTGKAEGKNALDLYAGCGVFSAFFAENFQNVFMVEHNKNAAAFAEANLRGRGHETFAKSGADFAKRHAASLAARKGQIDFAFADPPRSGIEREVLLFLCESGIPEIRYLSCNIQTQARDVARLLKSGYNVSEAWLLDFFPQTSHSESLVVLKKI